MDRKTIVVVGGGYAGFHAINSIRKVWGHHIGKDIRLILLDKESHHFKKVLLVKVPIRPEGLRVPYQSLPWTGVELVQGVLTDVYPERQAIHYRTSEGGSESLQYDQLVLSVGSVFHEPTDVPWGMTLHGEQDVKQIQDELKSLFARAKQADRSDDRENLLNAAIIGGGITGIELAAELATYMREKRTELGLRKDRKAVRLIHSGQRLLPHASNKVSHRLEQRLRKLGVEIIFNTKAVNYKDGVVTLTNGSVTTPLCIRTSGTSPNPLVQQLGLPVHHDGRMLVDETYRVMGQNRIYSIGDCAYITDPRTGQVDGMNCKEAMMQAKRLGKIMKAHMTGASAPEHKDVTTHFFCIALGPTDGFVWTKKWGFDFVISGTLARKVKEYAWRTASTAK